MKRNRVTHVIYDYLISYVSTHFSFFLESCRMYVEANCVDKTIIKT